MCRTRRHADLPNQVFTQGLTLNSFKRVLSNHVLLRSSIAMDYVSILYVSCRGIQLVVQEIETLVTVFNLYAFVPHR